MKPPPSVPVVDLGPAFWPDGVERSRDNCFCTPYGVPVDGGELEAHTRARARATRERNKRQAEGRDNSTIHGLSRKADKAIRRQKRAAKQK